MEIDELLELIKLTCNWTEKLVEGYDFSGFKHDRILRKTNPIINGKKLFEFNDLSNETELTTELYEYHQYEKILNIIIPNRRTQELKEIKDPMAYGSIICFVIGVTTHDGAPVAETHGFLDNYDIPPIDTWIALKQKKKSSSENLLLCWIPNKAKQIMQNGIDVEILGSYYWLYELEPKLNTILIEKSKNCS